LNLIGHGEAETMLREQVARAGLASHIRFLGKMPPEAVKDHLRRCALVCIPRKPFEVCRIVPPIKLVEALSLGKPVIAADLPVLRDELGDERAGWFFNAGDAAHLAEKIKEALRDRAVLTEKGLRAREYAVAHRNWRLFVQQVLPAFEGGRQDDR
jgi:glycosyltransferase involved in cell wall biosynthesis